MQFGSHRPTCERYVKVKVNMRVQHIPVLPGRAWPLKKTICLPWGWDEDNGHISKGLTPPCNPNKNGDTVIYRKPQPSALFPLRRIFCQWPSAGKHSEMEATFMETEKIAQERVFINYLLQNEFPFFLITKFILFI